MQTFIGQLPKNIFSGFVVSLVALPLALGLALASGAPPISGIIASVVGGIVCSVLGGSNVTITGPGNGLVVVLLSAITVLGNGDMYQGYLFTLAAIIISGALMFILGVLRLGSLSDFFPSSAIQGMLAAIGIGIFAKQFHVMLGNLSAKGSIVELLYLIPQGSISFIQSSDRSVFYAGLVGIISLLIMFFYSKIRNKYFQLIPAPMWIVVFSIAMYYYFNIFSVNNYPIKEELLIRLPDKIFGTLPQPNFSKFLNYEFLSTVLAITLIASIESLLSIKAVDKLDVRKRRSNVNKDIRSLGIATIISGFLGGLNVVTVIARSSVNVNNGGSNRSSNLFHGLFLLGFILLLNSELRKIPLSALAAILVYTGYKLASPENIKNAFRIGSEQLIIFLVTLITTIFTNLITGILIGILITFIIHIFINKNLLLFLRNLLKPNVLMFKEDEKYYVSVENFCSFLNYTKLKSKLDQIPEQEEVIIDFSMCDFVDHSVMENINSYSENFKRKGGHFEVVGLDGYKSGSQHPFAARKFVFENQKEKVQTLTKRQKSLQTISEELNWDYQLDCKEEIKEISEFGYFKTKQINKLTNVLSNNQCTLFDVAFSEGKFIAKQSVKATMLHIKLQNKIPEFTLDKEDIFEYIAYFAGFKTIDIDIAKHPDFSNRFYLSGKNKEQICQFFNDELILFFESNKYYHIESNEKGLLIINNERLAGIKEIKALADFGIRLAKIIS